MTVPSTSACCIVLIHRRNHAILFRETNYVSFQIVVIASGWDLNVSVYLNLLQKHSICQNFDMLKKTLESPQDQKKGRGIALARVLSDKLEVDYNIEGFTQIKVIKQKQLERLDSPKE